MSGEEAADISETSPVAPAAPRPPASLPPLLLLLAMLLSVSLVSWSSFISASPWFEGAGLEAAGEGEDETVKAEDLNASCCCDLLSGRRCSSTLVLCIEEDEDDGPATLGHPGLLLFVTGPELSP